MPRPVACTIVSNNYLHFARVFASSFLERHEDGEAVVLLVDRPHPDVDYDELPFRCVFAEDLAIPGFEHFAFRYSILELNTAVKPWFLADLEERVGTDAVCYFDPDILVTGELDELYGLLAGADAVLTPHILEPIEDELLPNERDFLLSGTYNLGFAGFSFNERTRAFLDWWHRRLYAHCRHAVSEGLFVDQRWMDLAPALLPAVRILRDPGYNVAYWNLMHRTLTPREGRWWVGEHPLRFFHFSGFDPDRPEMISKYQNRFRLEDRPDLHALFAHYEERLRAEGLEEYAPIPYAFDAFDDGEPVPSVARWALHRIDAAAERWPRPFAAAGDDSFRAWLLASPDAGGEACLPRLALFLRERRSDLREAFPEVPGRDETRYLRWLVDGGAEEAGFGEAARARLDEVALEMLADPDEPAKLDASREPAPPATPSSRPASPPPGPPDPLLPSGYSDLDPSRREWLRGDADLEGESRPRIPRLAMRIHERRPDLQRSFPDPLGTSRLPFARWMATYGRREYALPRDLLAPLLETLPWQQRLRAFLWWQRQRLRNLAAGPRPAP